MTILASIWLVALASSIAGAQSLDDLPRLVDDVQAHYVSSHDRTGGNDDGFNGTYSALYVDDNGEHIIVDVKGPGILWNLWFTSRVNGRSPLGFGEVRFYFDDEVEPRIAMDANELFSGRHPPFVSPFVYHAFQSTGGYVSYMPMPFGRRLKIATERRVGFYNAYYHTFAPDRVVTSWSADADRSSVADLLDGRLDVSGAMHSGRASLPAPLTPDGEMEPTKSALFERQGSGVITAFRVSPLFPLTPYQLNHIRLRMFWDGSDEPAVDAPLGSFFGSGLGEASVRAVPLGMSPSGPYYCYLPMPFWEYVRIELLNETPEKTPELWWELRVAENTYDRDTTGYFYAHYAREWPTTTGADFRLLDEEGRGKYVGQVMTVEPLRSEIKRWWEGDLRIHLDGQRDPAFHGTGHEDEYFGGWSNEWLMNPYSLPMHGQPKTEGLAQVDFQWSAATTVYRFFMAAVPFQNGISVSTEHGASNTANAMYSSVSFYYARARGMDQLHALDGDRNRWSIEIPSGYRSLRIRRLYDARHVQEAEVWVNGQRAGVWYSAQTSGDELRATSDFILPGALTRGRSKLDVEIRAVRPGWNASRYEVWGIP